MSMDTDKYEHVVFLNDCESKEAFSILDNEGKNATLEYLTQWHDIGQHEGSNNPSYGTNDEVYEVGNYIMSWNKGLGYIGLDYKF